jgi:DNA-binding MarR family transcriptional regulator
MHWDAEELDSLDHAAHNASIGAGNQYRGGGMAEAPAIAIIAIAMKIDPYIVDTLMRDLVAHSHSSAAFLVYLQLYRHTHGTGRESAAMSHKVLADLIGISKRSVQSALAHLIERRFIRRRKLRPTAVPVYTVLTPWMRKGLSAS